MINPRKTNQFFGGPGSFGIILAALIAVSVLSQLLSSGTAPKILLGFTVVFAGWWLYQRFVKKPSNSNIDKYQHALKRQKKNKPSGSIDTSKGKVVYLNKVKRK